MPAITLPTNGGDANTWGPILNTAITAINNAVDAVVTSDSLKAADNAVVKLSGDQTVAGVKTFSSAPVVPDGSFATAKTSGLQAALDGKVPLGDATISPTGAPYISRYNNSDQATLHLTASGAFNAPYIVGIGNDVGNKYGLLVSNKAAGVGAVFNNAATATAADGYALRVTNASTAAPGALFESTGASSGPAVRITTDTAASITARRLMQWAGQPGGTYTVFGEVWGDGTFNWAGTARFRGNIGFYNTAPIAKPTVSGSLASGTAVLSSLLTALSNLGLITNSSTA